MIRRRFSKNQLLNFFNTITVSFFFLIALPCIVSGQPLQEIKGVVLHIQNQQPVQGVSVSITGTKRGTVSSADGKFSIRSSLPANLTLSAVGFMTLTYSVSSDTGTQVIYLTPLFTEQNIVTVVGSRGRPRTDITRPVPVDVISSKELESTGQVDLAQMAQFTSPSFVSVKTGLNGAANYADPASLKGMSPDQSLVLINNKRRHQFAAISNTLLPGKGSVITDLNGIPALALERMEILRDGTAAQYGSDAIAGIINLILRKNESGGVIRSEWGVTHKGDGITFTTSLNKGWSLGKEGSFINFTFAAQSVTGTDRSDPYKGTIYSSSKITDDSIRNARGRWPANEPAYVMKYGSNQTRSIQAFLHFAYPINNNWKWYGFGGNSNKEIVAYGFFRTAKKTDPNSSDLYPDGYSPLLPGKTADYSFVTGLERSRPNGWNIDLSTGYGYNHLDLYSKNSCNPSLGLSSPTEFYVGRNAFGQSTSEANFSRTLKNSRYFNWINIAMGTQVRVDHYRMKEGDPASSAIGPLAVSENKAAGSSGRPGIALSDRTSKWRTNVGSYVDVEADVNDRLMFALAGRFENYNDFGSNLSGKLAARWSLTEHFSIRGSINRGFRAPSLQQIYNSQTTSNAQNGLIRQTKQLPADDPRLAQLGIPFPGPELSWNYNIGWTAKLGNTLLLTLDAYQIDVKDRIIISEVLLVSAAIPSLRTVFPVSTAIREITFFTNHINTRNRGLDLVISWKKIISTNQRLNINVAYAQNQTTLTGQKEPPALLQNGAAAPIKLIDTLSEALIRTAQPRQKLIASLDYSLKRLQATLRFTYFGPVTAWEKPANLRHLSQTFRGKTLCDLSAAYRITNKWLWSLGVNNLFNVYPDRVNPLYASYTNGQVTYSRSAVQFGFNGAFWFSSVQFSF